jgi:hypothetical protein
MERPMTDNAYAYRYSLREVCGEPDDQLGCDRGRSSESSLPAAAVIRALEQVTMDAGRFAAHAGLSAGTQRLCRPSGIERPLWPEIARQPNPAAAFPLHPSTRPGTENR